MLKYVIYTLIIVVLIIIGLYFSIKLPFQVIQGNITYAVAGCLGRAEEQSRALDTIDFSAEGNVIVVRHTLQHSCCLNLTMDQSIEDDVITITENLAGSACRCYCHSDVTAKIGSLQRKKYTVNVYNNEGGFMLVGSEKFDLS